MNINEAEVTFKVHGKPMQQEFMNFAGEQVKDIVKIGGNDFCILRYRFL